MKIISVRSNILINAIRLCLTALFPLLTLPYVSRILKPDGVGKVNLALSVVVYFSMVASLGIPLYGLREAARIRENKNELSKFVREILIINAITTIFSFFIYSLIVFTIPRFVADLKIFIIVGMTIPFTFIGFEWLYQALEQYAYITIRSFIFQSISLVFLFVFVNTPDDVWQYAALNVFASVGMNIANFLNIRKYVNIHYKGILNLRKHILPIVRLFLMTAASSVYLYLTTIMLGLISGNAAVGCYTTALKIVSMAQAVVAISAVVAPRGSFLLEKNDIYSFQLLVGKATRLSIMLILPLVVGVVILAPDLIEYFAGSLFVSAVPVLRITVLKLLFIGISYITTVQVLIPQRKEKIAIISYAGAAILSLLLNYFLISNYSVIGAAITTTVVEAIIAFTQLNFCRNSVGKALVDKRNVPYLIGTALVALSSLIIVMLLESVIYKLVLCGVTGLFIYFFVLLGLKDEFAILIWYKILSLKRH